MRNMKKVCKEVNMDKCKNCMCGSCSNACQNCSNCINAEYAEDNYEDLKILECEDYDS